MGKQMNACTGIFAAAAMMLIGCGGGSTGTTPPAVHNKWTWTAGADSVNQVGSYGTLGVPSSSNAPGGRVSASSWTDASGDFWLFGGYGAGAILSSTVFEGDLNDLWKYSGGEWTWVSGSNQTEQAGTYGTEGTAAPGNFPGARWMAVSWTDVSGSFWMFGGIGIDSTGTRGNLSDLWKYSAGQWTWMSGSNIASQPGIATQPIVYGVKGTAAPGNVPGARAGASSWSDAAGNLWLFGGEGLDSTGTLGILNDLWKFSAGEWTWMSGSNIVGQLGTYGTQGTADPGNVPGARVGANSWTDASGNLWLFGGEGQDANGIFCTQNAGPCELNDLWKYSGGEWTWMGGSNFVDHARVYGTQGIAAPGNVPGARDSAVSWTDTEGNLWLFGGIGCDSSGVCGTEALSDLWKYSGGQWTWMIGSNLAGQPGSYGTLGTAATSNLPGCRDGAVGWTDSSGNLWLFSGQCSGKLNDLWEYQP